MAEKLDKDSENEKDNKLENQLYYHGLREKNDAMDELRNEGDFMVRASMVGGYPQILLNVMDRKGPCNLLVDVLDNGRYALRVAREDGEVPTFRTIVHLVDYYKKNYLPCLNTRLRKPISRPTWCIRSAAITYADTNRLGEGNFCAVYAGTLNLNGSLRQAAIKVCHQDANMTPEQIQEACRSMLNETKIMALYAHENIVEFFGVCCDHPPIRLVLEFCAGGSLDAHLRKHGGGILRAELLLYAFEASLGMRYLHSRACIHRDLAARNCLISSAGIIKIGDFGLSKIADKEYKEEKALKHIPLRWMAPETLRRPPMYLTNSDVWSFGALLFELFNKGQAPFHDEDDFKKIAKRIRAGDMPKAPKDMPSLITKMLVEDIWVVEPEKRIFFPGIVHVLLAYLEQNAEQMPPVSDLAVNRIKGVRRLMIFTCAKNEYLHPDMCTKKKPVDEWSKRVGQSTRSKKRRRVRRGPRKTGSGRRKDKDKEKEKVQFQTLQPTRETVFSLNQTP